jgi:hypothetical protein
MSLAAYGTTLEVNDGASSAYVAIGDVVDMQVPDIEQKFTESKRLTMTNQIIGKVLTVKDAGMFSFTVEHADPTQRARLKALKSVSKNFRIKFPDNTRFTFPATVVKIPPDSLNAESILQYKVEAVLTGDITEDIAS